MDLRVKKTKRSIKAAFLALRNDIPLEKIRVTDICEAALINKTTFYKHYRDIYTLSSEMEREAISHVMESFTAKDNIFRNPMGFIMGLPKALDDNTELLQPLFGDQPDKLFYLLEKELIDYYRSLDRTDNEEIILTFAVGGTLHTLREMKSQHDCDDILLAKITSEILTKINELRRP